MQRREKELLDYWTSKTAFKLIWLILLVLEVEEKWKFEIDFCFKLKKSIEIEQHELNHVMY